MQSLKPNKKFTNIKLKMQCLFNVFVVTEKLVLHLESERTAHEYRACAISTFK